MPETWWSFPTMRVQFYQVFPKLNELDKKNFGKSPGYPNHFLISESFKLHLRHALLVLPTLSNSFN